MYRVPLYASITIRHQERVQLPTKLVTSGGRLSSFPFITIRNTGLVTWRHAGLGCSVFPLAWLPRLFLLPSGNTTTRNDSGNNARLNLRREVAGDVEDQLREPVAKASTCPLLVGTIAMLLVIDPSAAFSVETTGWFSPSGHNVR